MERLCLVGTGMWMFESEIGMSCITVNNFEPLQTLRSWFRIRRRDCRTRTRHICVSCSSYVIFPPHHSLLSDIISDPWSSLVVAYLQICLRHQTYIFITKRIENHFFLFQVTEETSPEIFRVLLEQSWNGNRKTSTIESVLAN